MSRSIHTNEPENRMNAPVIVLSTPRSGSSWMSRLLRDHPDLHVYTHNTLHTQLLYLLYPLRTFNPIGDDAVERRGATDALLDPIRTRIAARYYRNESPAKTLVLASPTNVEFVPLLARAFPGVRLVHLSRNPLDVVASFRKFLEYNGRTGVSARFRRHRHHGLVPATRSALAHVFHSMRWMRVGEPGYVGTRPTGFQDSAKLPTLEFLTWYYLRLEEQMLDALATVEHERRHQLTYEGLVTDCERELERLFEFIGVPVYPDRLRAAAEGVRSGGIGRHKTLLTPGEIDLVERSLATYGRDDRSVSSNLTRAARGAHS